jgi:hypothetical protein
MNPLQIPATDLGEYDPRRLEISNDEAVERLQEAVGEVSDTLTRHQAVDLEWLTNILESCQVLLSAAQRRALPEAGLVAMANDHPGDALPPPPALPPVPASRGHHPARSGRDP